MRLYDISAEAERQGVSDCDVTGITDNTGKMLEGNIFVCIEGKNFDGHSAAAEMLEKGAAAVVVSHDLGLERQIVVSDTRAYFAALASAYYGHPTKRLKLLAVTGTNGKSTIAGIVSQMLGIMGHKCGCIGTVGYDVCGKVYEAHLTTPAPMDLYRYFAEMVENGAEYCIMEASSQALSQRRFAQERFECGIFTNLTQDHLDWHGTMENYYKAKKLLFGMTERAVINTDDRYGERLAKEIKGAKTCSVTGLGDYFAMNIKLSDSCVKYWISSTTEEKSYPVTFGMPGKFNVANSLAAIAACVEIGFPFEECVKAAAECVGTTGRSEVIYSGEFTVMSDYAHTPDALEKILLSVKSFARKRIICLFGAAGERDATKRRAMGKIVARYADYAVVTSDNPRFEDPDEIIKQVMSGFGSGDITSVPITDRREAIAHALAEAESGDIVLLCGKGHETYQVIGDDYTDFDERKIVAEIMAEKENKTE